MIILQQTLPKSVFCMIIIIYITATSSSLQFTTKSGLFYQVYIDHGKLELLHTGKHGNLCLSLPAW